MDCSEFFRMLDNYSSLSGTQLAELEAHAAECDKCRNELEFFKHITKTAASLKAPSPPSDLAGLYTLGSEQRKKEYKTVCRSCRMPYSGHSCRYKRQNDE